MNLDELPPGEVGQVLKTVHNSAPIWIECDVEDCKCACHDIEV